MITLTILKATGEIAEVSAESFSLAELQKLVGGYIEVTHLTPQRQACPGYGNSVMVVNEEGRIKGLPENVRASTWAGQSIVGDAVVCDQEVLQ